MIIQVSPLLNSPLELICVGTGRDATTSLSQMIQQTYDQQGEGKTVGHEWAGMDLYRHFCDFKETGDKAYLQRIDELLQNCPHHCIVGNGYASVLPHFARIFGKHLKFVHLQRRDREACVASMARNCELFPGNHLYYAESDEAHSKRMAAFHYGEMTREQWDALPMLEKYGWFYDKTHALIRAFMPLFPKSIHVETESLTSEETREAIGRIAGADFAPPGIHVNRHVDTDALPVESRLWIQRALGKLDLERLANDDVYGVDHFLHEFSHKMAYRINEVIVRNPEALKEIGQTISRGKATIQRYIEKLEELERIADEARSQSLKPKEENAAS